MGIYTNSAIGDVYVGNSKIDKIFVGEDLVYSALFINPILNNNSWATISAVSSAGTAANYWDVGDCKEITLNGTVGTLNLSNVTLCVYILGFDHNSAVEGSGISFGTFKSALTNGIDVALIDDYYNNFTSCDGTKLFQIEHWGTIETTYGISIAKNDNYGGWAACDMRYDILGSTNQAPSPYGSSKTSGATGSNPTSTCTSNPVSNTLMAALSSDLRAVIKPITKYTDNVAGNTNVAANVTTTIDYLPLLSEYEVQGARTYANQYEYTNNKQVQYQYFINGNSKVKYKYNDTSTTCIWWGRSPDYGGVSRYCYVSNDGGANHTSASVSYGLAPIFLV